MVGGEWKCWIEGSRIVGPRCAHSGDDTLSSAVSVSVENLRVHSHICNMF